MFTAKRVKNKEMTGLETVTCILQTRYISHAIDAPRSLQEQKQFGSLPRLSLSDNQTVKSARLDTQTDLEDTISDSEYDLYEESGGPCITPRGSRSHGSTLGSRCHNTQPPRHCRLDSWGNAICFNIDLDLDHLGCGWRRFVCRELAGSGYAFPPGLSPVPRAHTRRT